MSIRVMILDDDQCRHDAFSRRLERQGCIVLHAYTAKQAIKTLAEHQAFDLVCLDHDLDLVDLIEEAGCGMDVAEYIRLRLERDRYPRQILIHSWNRPAAKRMEAAIREAGIPVVARRFSPQLEWLNVSVAP